VTASSQPVLDWSDLQLLGAFAGEEDISACAKQFHVDETTISRRLKRLSMASGVAVVEIRDRKLVLTDAGRALARATQPMFDAAMHVARVAEQQTSGPKGLVRITAIRAVLGRIILPGINGFRAAFPDIEIELLGDTRNLSLIRREADVAIRLALPSGNELVTRKLGDMAFAIYGVAGKGAKAQDWLGYGEALGHVPEAQWLERNRGEKPVVLRANGIEMLVAAVRQGLGKAVLPCFIGDQEQALQRVEAQPVLFREVWLAVHDDDRRSARIRAVMDLVIQQFDRMRNAIAGSRA
jgi:DNA-binding transcriptional LysR family regulator